jgi:hypothetical protein
MDSQTQHYLAAALLVLLGFVLGRIGGGRERGGSSSSRAAPPITYSAPPTGGEFDEAGVLAELRAGRFIDAIKRYRQHYRCDLREAKRAVEALADRYGIRR